MSHFRYVRLSLALLLLLQALGDSYAQAPPNPAAALKAAREAALLNPRNVPAQIILAEITLDQFLDAEALRAASTASALAPDNVLVQALLAKTLFRRARYEEGLKIFDTLPEVDRRRYELTNSAAAARLAQQAEMLQAAALATAALDDDREVAKLLRQATEKSPDLLPIKKTLAFWYLDQLREPQNALPLLQTLTERQPDDLEGQTMLAQATLQLGRFRQALQLYQALLSRDPENIDLQIGQAKALIGTGERAMGLEKLRALATAEPGNSAVQQALKDAQKPGAVGHDLMNPAAIDLFQQAQQLLFDAGEDSRSPAIADAAKLLEQALVLEPESVELRKSLGYLYLEKLRRPRAAYQLLTQADRLKPDDVDILKLLGLAALNSDRHCEAIELLERALAKEPQNLWIRVNLGRAYARGGVYHAALNLYNEVLASDPGNFTARLGIAEVQAWRGYSDAPIAMTEQLVAESPTNAEARTLLGDLYRWDYDLDLAASEYDQALTYEPGNEAASDGLYEIDKTLSYVASVDAYQFVDNSKFDRRFFSSALRAPITNKAFLTPRWTEWRYKQGTLDIDRDDAILDLEYHFNRQWQATARFLNYEYSYRDSQQAGNVTAKYSPLATVDMFFTAGNNEPAYLTDIGIPLANIRMNNYAYAFDIELLDQWSTQGSITYSDYSDGNERRLGMAQLSYQLDPCYDTFIRLQYEDLSFKDQTPIYFSPGNFEVLRLIADIDHPVTETLDVLARLEGLEVFGQGTGYVAKIGPRWRPNDRMEIRGSYFNLSVPGAAPFSGQGFDAFASLRF